jgi:predicted PurR-regulated permease PerM
MKRVAQIAAAVALALLAALLVWEFREAAILFLLSLAVAATLRPLVDRQVRRGWPRFAAVLFIYVLTVGLVFAIAWTVAGPMLDDVRQLIDNLSLSYEGALIAWPNGAGWQQQLVAWMPPTRELTGAIAGPAGTAMLQGALGFTQGLVDIASRLLIITVMSLYWAVDEARFERLWLSVLPAETRARARDIWRATEAGAGAYIRSELTQSLLAGALLGIGFHLLGLPYPTLLAIICALAWLIPWLGTVLAVVPVLLVGASVGPVSAVLAAAYTIVIFFGLEFVVEPRLYDRRQYSSLLVVLVVIVLGQVYGILGLLAAPPLAAALQILLSRLVTPAALPVVASTGVEQFEALKARLISVQTALAVAPEVSPQLASLTQRLAGLVAQVEKLEKLGALDRVAPGADGAAAANDSRQTMKPVPAPQV